ncbi:MAG: PilZ domain-containing protein [Candidatus Omnitrophica bacterium]|nr:PilZ domain-containing protein [Candidatus Omnitrophota bacterium]
MKERRSCFRWQIDHPAKLKLEGAESFASCIVNNITLKGIKISLRIRLPLDTFLRFTLVLKEGFVLDNIEGWLVWHKTLIDTNIYGLYFTKLKDLDKEKIYKFVQTFYPKQIQRQYWQGLEEDKIIKQDRRIFARIPVQIPLRFIELDSNKEGAGLTYDISAKGIGLLTPIELSPNTSIELWLDIPNQTQPFYTRANVVWSKRISPDIYRIGLNLEKANLMELSRALKMFKV